MNALRSSILEAAGPSRRGSRSRQLGPVLLAIATFLLAMPLLLVPAFPYEHLAAWISQQVEAPRGPDGKRRPSGWQLDIGALSPLFPVGLRGEAITLAHPASGVPHAELFVEQLDVRISPLALLTGSVTGELGARLGGGTLQADFDVSLDGDLSVQAKLQGIRLRRIGLLRALIPLPMRGTLGGEIDLRTTMADPSKSDGRIRLHVAGLSLGDGESKLPLPGMSDGITLERVDAGKLDLQAQIDEGLLRIEHLRARGPDVRLDVLGTMRLARRLRASRLDLKVRVLFDEAFRNRSDRTRAIFSLLEFSPQLRRARAKDGALQWQVTGALGSRLRGRPAGSMRFEVADSGGRPSSTGRPRRKGAK